MFIPRVRTARRIEARATSAVHGAIRHHHLREFTFGVRHIGADIIAANEDWLLDISRTCDPAQLHQIMGKLPDGHYPEELDERRAKGMDKEDRSRDGDSRILDVGHAARIASPSSAKQFLSAKGAHVRLRCVSDRSIGAGPFHQVLDLFLHPVVNGPGKQSRVTVAP